LIGFRLVGDAMKLSFRGLSVWTGLLCGSLLLAVSAQAETINPIFSSSFTCTVCGINPATVVSLQGDPAAEAAITAAANQVSSQFGNAVTANILFVGVHDGTNGFLGASISGSTVYTYSQYVTALAADAAAHPTNTILNSAVANLGSGNGAENGAGNSPPVYISANTTDARVLGLNFGASTAFGVSGSTPQFDATGDYLGGGGTVDGIVFLNLDQPLSFTRPIQDPSAGIVYDVETTMEHEIDEVMGIGGAGSQLNDFNADSNYAEDFFGVSGEVLGPMDLYRYAAPGTPSFDPVDTSVTGCGPPTCTGDPSPYFSVDGGLTSIDTFNQAFPLIGGDAGDWGLNLFASCPGGGEGGTGDVQDAFSCSNHTADVMPGTPSYEASEAIGYDPVPEPVTWAMVLFGLGGVGATMRMTRRRHGAVGVSG